MIRYLFFALILGNIQSTSFASQRCSESIGYATIWNGNIKAAYDQSKTSALRNAVESTVGLFVSSKSKIGDFKEIHDKIYTMSEGFVNNYTVLNQMIVDSTLVKSKVNACVSLRANKPEFPVINVLADELNYPKIGFHINSKTCNSDSSFFSGFYDAFLKAGIPSSILRTTPRNELDQAKQLDIIFEISVSSEPSMNTTIPYSSRSLKDYGYQPRIVIVDFSCYWLDTNEIISQKSLSKTFVSRSFCSNSPFIPKETQLEIARSITSDLLLDWNKRLLNGRFIYVSVPLSHQHIDRFKNILNETNETKNSLREINYVNDILRIGVNTPLSTQEFARRLVSVSQIRKDTVSFDEITFNTLSLRWSWNNDND